ncbi:DUF1272 domain-containing protein [Thiothrix winogradskyi]|uniref:DUF1272 domain-containing protein n=1 Tax=Thiothrix winogradskyi TaxID=96472 RepID=A0ABY3T0H6_9GAMM|nr:DUF1272 domain-containing protein [Thiothrix winogradskyi]UJS24689.1 DUF1272 domain-containing protein [Thiothrix winogradskyi]
MLELRPTCENCNKPLPPHATDAMICSFECTFCSDCVSLLSNTCPNCGGGFVPRPIRPVTNWKGDNYLGEYPAATIVKLRPVDWEAHRHLLLRLQGIPPEKR